MSVSSSNNHTPGATPVLHNTAGGELAALSIVTASVIFRMIMQAASSSSSRAINSLSNWSAVHSSEAQDMP
jgi:hypothetical protein